MAVRASGESNQTEAARDNGWTARKRVTWINLMKSSPDPNDVDANRVNGKL